MSEHAVDPSNAGQHAAWNGDQGAYWAVQGDRFDLAMAGYHEPFLAAAEIAPGERVLDIGCGNGQTSRDAAGRAGAGAVLGIDLSGRMLARARELAAAQGVRNVRFEQADAQVHPFGEAEFDVAISRCGAMFFGDPPAAFGNIARALRPRGRLVLLAWQPVERNEWASAFLGVLAAHLEFTVPPPGEPGPFALGDPLRVQALLAGAGLTEVRLYGLTEPMCFGADVEDAFSFVLGQFGWLLRDLGERASASVHEELRLVLAEHQTERGVLLGSSAWLVFARRS